MKRDKLISYIKSKFSGIERKYTGEPYYNHLENVAKMVDDVGVLLFEIALCHDLLEDTDTSDAEFLNLLLVIGYNETESSVIYNGVINLTDVFTHEKYPNINR